MSEQVISLTNRKKIPMSLPDGDGRQVNLLPGETRMVRGDFEHYRRMPALGMNGLVVKLVKGKSRLVEAGKKIDEVRMITVTNHRNIPMMLVTGIGQKRVKIGPRATSEPFLARVSTVKQMSGITVKTVEGAVEDLRAIGKTETLAPDGSNEPKDEDAGKTKEAAEVEAKAKQVAEDEAKKSEAAKAEVAAKVTKAVAAKAEADAIAEQAAEDEAKKEKEAAANDPLAIKRRELALPATRKEWDIYSQQVTWPDVRGLCKELEIKTGAKNKKELLEAITEKLYPKS